MKGILSIEFDNRDVERFAKGLDAQRILNGVIHETAKEVKEIVKRDVNRKYHGGTGWIGSAVGRPVNGHLQSVISIKGTRGVIGQRFATTGNAYNIGPSGIYGFSGSGKKRGWALLKQGKGTKITARIVKGKASTLPGTLPNQGGNPPFLLKGTAMTRRTQKNKPIVRVAGLAVPQMITARSKDDITRDIIQQFEKKLDAEFKKL